MAIPSPLYKLFIVLSSACCALAAPAGNVDVRLKTGIIRGVTQSNGQDKFLGIPFAQPPVGNLRFKAPVAITAPSNAVINASAFGNACPQPAASFLGAPIGEDCLHLNIFRPAGLKSNAKLPVLFWLHGGAFTVNAASNPQFDPTGLIQRSVEIGKPIVFVSTNYRLNTFGFLASSSVLPEDLNAGMLDQRLALEFVQDNIAAFGGDPDKVTIWGQSAGAGSVEAHFLFPTERRLFRAGIADSSTGPFKNSPDASTFDKPGKPFTRLLEATGCAAGSTAVSCLQKVSFQTLMSISNTMISNTLDQQLWQAAVGPKGSFMTERGSKKIESGAFLHLPYISGTNLNEGTFFTPTLLGLGLSGAAETAAFRNFILNLVIDNSTLTNDVINTFISMFPANDPANGAPFNTGDSLFDRTSAWYTDHTFLAPRRFFFQRTAARMPMFAYFFGEFIPGNNITNGVTHQSELELLFGPIPPVAEVETEFSTTYRDFYLNFVNNLNPGAGWPQYTPASPKVLQLVRNNITLIPDTWDLDKTDFSNSARVRNEFQK